VKEPDDVGDKGLSVPSRFRKERFAQEIMYCVRSRIKRRWNGTVTSSRIKDTRREVV
jgi:hypothetical protein